MTVSVVIVTYNSREVLGACLDSLGAAAVRTPCEVILVDNGSTDGTLEWVRSRGTRVIANAENVGFARATNIGIRASRADAILMLNGDTVLPAGAIDALVARLDGSPTIGAVGPRLVDLSGRAELSFGRMIGPLVEIRQKFLVTLNDARTPGISSYVDALTRREQYPDWVSGACLLVRRSDAEEVGLLDERFFMYGEDVDFCAALRQRGRRVLFTPAVEVVHVRGASGTRSKTTAIWQQSHLAFYEKHHPGWVPMLRLYLRTCGKLPLEPGDRGSGTGDRNSQGAGAP